MPVSMVFGARDLLSKHLRSLRAGGLLSACLKHHRAGDLLSVHLKGRRADVLSARMHGLRPGDLLLHANQHGLRPRRLLLSAHLCGLRPGDFLSASLHPCRSGELLLSAHLHGLRAHHHHQRDTDTQPVPEEKLATPRQPLLYFLVIKHDMIEPGVSLIRLGHLPGHVPSQPLAQLPPIHGGSRVRNREGLDPVPMLFRSIAALPTQTRSQILNSAGPFGRKSAPAQPKPVQPSTRGWGPAPAPGEEAQPTGGWGPAFIERART